MVSRWHLFGLACALSLSAPAAQADTGAAASAAAPAGQRATPPGAKVSAGQLLADEKAFVAGPEGATLDLIEGAQLRLDPGTRLRFGRTFKMALGARPDDLVPTRVLMLDSGWMEATLLAKEFALFVEAPRKLRSILLGGSITVIASEPRSTVALGQGNALVALDDGWKWKRLSEGSMQIVSDVRPDGYRRPILPALDKPALSHSLMLSTGGDTDATELTWPALPQAVGYEIQLHSGAALVRSVRTKETRLALSGLPPGQYQLTVRG
ncbi:MAG TPA: hypothetical protein VG963_02650, partial [Polyangiaceae bacterium]|nr:hypothetical protein [Polyangiaceae bacterium]